MGTISSWNFYVNFKDGARLKLNDEPFVGTVLEAMRVRWELEEKHGWEGVESYEMDAIEEAGKRKVKSFAGVKGI